MNLILRTTLITVIGLFSSPTLLADESKKVENAQFKMLTSLVGSWKGYKNDEKDKPVALKYELSSAGNSVVERMFYGTPQEMVSVYHKDGDNLLMTHYCSLGNQPRMQSGKTNNSDKIKFNFKDITNVKSEKDAHMHNLTLSVIDKNTLQQEWTMYADGKAKKTSVFTFSKQ